MTYKPIENYGIVGDMHSAALLSREGSVDWLCLPRFDSPAVFAAILDDKKGGCFDIRPVREDVRSKQFYWPDTNVLITRFLCSDGVGQVTDFMPVGLDPESPRRRTLIRQVRTLRGRLRFRLRCAPAFNFARDAHEVEVDSGGAWFRSVASTLRLTSPISLRISDRGEAITEFVVSEGDELAFAIGLDADHTIPPIENGEATAVLNTTVDYWRHWLSQCRYQGRWREMVHRSALALKLLTYQPSGAIVAAPTTSLPEGIGGHRNWDYRYTWIRDAAFTLYALLRIGFTGEAAAFMGWLEERAKESGAQGPLQIMYAVDGAHELIEEELDHLDGYMGSKPVRVGNAAYGQLQLDIYGELMDSVYLYNKYGAPISYDLWNHLRELVDWTAENWQRKDEGIWEVRGGQQHFVYSKLMCWVALDRGLRLADKRSFPAPRPHWMKVRDTIYEEIMSRGWSAQRGAFTQAYDSQALDAANLLMPMVFFMAPNDPRMLETLNATMMPPSKGGLLSNSLVYRYDVRETDDGLSGEEGSFNICTFWLVEALTRAGRTDQRLLERARFMFEEMLGYANHVGLFAEQTGPSGEALGNFPQAFTHLALISAAFNLDRALGSRD